MENFEWANELSCAVTVCDCEGVVLWQNIKAVKTFESYGDLIGKNLKDCHAAKSWEVIHEMIQNGTSNSYTIEKNGIKKLIHQTPWYKEGAVAGLVEFSIELPLEIPHFKR
ncbi:MAG: PAS sensor protein [Bacteroidales bacterium]|jgi:transcriptional regulator with PAS, ATPase and Fis domain|nr:PAS sensor protein [Bacteroidales bacterium]